MTVADQLAQALADLMGAEGGEPDPELGPEHLSAWAAAEDALIAYRARHDRCPDGWTVKVFDAAVGVFSWPCGAVMAVAAGPHTTRPWPEFVAHLHDQWRASEHYRGQTPIGVAHPEDVARVRAMIDPDERGGATGNGHPSTSRRAAVNVRRGSQQSALLAVLSSAGHDGVTCFEATPTMRTQLGRDDLARNQVAARMGELQAKGLVTRRRAVDAGEGSPYYVERATDGATAAVWYITPAGVAERERLAHA